MTTMNPQNVQENLETTEQEDDSDPETLESQAGPWKIKKKLQIFDLNKRLLVLKRQAERFVLPVLEASDDEIEKGYEVDIWDVDTKTTHSLIFQKRSKSYVFTGNWNEDFCKRRDLKLYDTVGLYWDPSNKCFDFSVLEVRKDRV
uniref:B3 domain-containing protein At2g33720 family n=2 Tax=Cajanus cajan TaxID=3821 RepID=A0A151QWM0_CAJCA|nr:B3 domain-containing protein At2g33720 family [Cajanus cajan]